MRWVFALLLPLVIAGGWVASQTRRAVNPELPSGWWTVALADDLRATLAACWGTRPDLVEVERQPLTAPEALVWSGAAGPRVPESRAWFLNAYDLRGPGATAIVVAHRMEGVVELFLGSGLEPDVVDLLRERFEARGFDVHVEDVSDQLKAPRPHGYR